MGQTAPALQPAEILTAPTIAATTANCFLAAVFTCSVRLPGRHASCSTFLEREEKIMETILIVVVLLFLFGGGGYYWNSRRG
jgi:hypothetical protein